MSVDFFSEIRGFTVRENFLNALHELGFRSGERMG
jgi:hypothetical protein